jgi:two-component system, NarL family, invasion response regulator UvrY
VCWCVFHTNGTAATPEPVQSSAAMMKILLIDDHSIVRFGVRQLIQQRWPGAHVVEAATLAQALQEVRASAWDVVIADLNLPDAHGVECVAQLRKAAPAVPILVLSMHSETAYATQVLRMGAMGYLTKERAPEELVAAVERVANGQRYITAAVADLMADQLFGDTQPLAHHLLAPQEYRVMLQLAAGQRIADIAQSMHLSPKTISTYRTRILEKLGLQNNVELVRYCLTHHLGQVLS